MKWADNCHFIKKEVQGCHPAIKSQSQDQDPKLSCSFMLSALRGVLRLHTLAYKKHLVHIFTGVLFCKLSSATTSCLISPKCPSVCPASRHSGEGDPKQADQPKSTPKELWAEPGERGAGKGAVLKDPLEHAFVNILHLSPKERHPPAQKRSSTRSL